MKKILSLLAIGCLGMSMNSGNDLKIGDAAPLQSLKMEDISGTLYNLTDLNDKKGLLVIFSCNTCPYVLTWEETYPELFATAQKNGIGMVLVNSNEAKRTGDDSKIEMQTRAHRGEYKMPYVIDANAELADAFGANTTPHVYLFDGNLNLAYKGAIDDKFESSEKIAHKHYLLDALKQLGSNQKISLAETKNRGCSIKRK